MIRFKRLPENIKEKIESLPEFLDKEDDVVFAYLFGGLLRKKLSPLSDIDIAIYIKNKKKFDYLEFYCRLTDFLETDEVDLI
ncbi:MAG: nucleotidyltransferase domain-containing protein, partial [Candidatus Goldbacteria bacterium]|nr:nucleotidyltransferase domain-containing protein [Candidatus Goldiibacteriota bacterium]